MRYVPMFANRRATNRPPEAPSGKPIGEKNPGYDASYRDTLRTVNKLGLSPSRVPRLQEQGTFVVLPKRWSQEPTFV